MPHMICHIYDIRYIIYHIVYIIESSYEIQPNYIFEKNLKEILCITMLQKSIEIEDLIVVLDLPIQTFIILGTKS